MPFLFIQRQRALLMDIFKIYNKQGPLYLHDLFLPAGNVKQLGPPTLGLWKVHVTALTLDQRLP